MNKSIYRLLDEAYNRVVGFFEDFIECVVQPFCELIAAALFAVVIYGTFPLWVVPYKIIKKRGKHNE